MASLYKKERKVVDPRTGEPVVKRSAKWWGKYVNADGDTKRVPLARDKTAAEEMLRKLVRQAERGAAGLTDPYEAHAKRRLVEHLKEYHEYLVGKGTAEHAQQTKFRIEAIVDGCGFVRVGDVSGSRVAAWLADQRKADAHGARTSNYYLTAMKGFCTWLVKDRRIPSSPIGHLSAMNATADVRVERRAMSPNEVEALVRAARNGEPFRGLSGEDRAALYLVAVNTGLRANELASLTEGSLDLGGAQPAITVEAGYSKRRRRDVQPIRQDVAEMLQQWLQSRRVGAGPQTIRLVDSKAVPPRKASEVKLWPGRWAKKGAEMIRIDLASAGVLFKDEAGCVVDFHALRHTFISGMAAAGVHPKVAQTLARHSTITLTMDRYTHVSLSDVAGALDHLPGLPVEQGKQRATGTDDVVADCRELEQQNRGAHSGAQEVAKRAFLPATRCNEVTEPKALENAEFPEENAVFPEESELRLLGLEPRTYGLKVRCSTD